MSQTTRQQCAWTGASGRSYTYFVYSLPCSFNKNQPGNYIYCRINARGNWVPVYIGQGDLGDRIGPNHHQAACIRSKGATHVHVHLNRREQDRRAEESDLLAAHPESYQPTGCNEKIGG